jgi:hypothetical protein
MRPAQRTHVFAGSLLMPLRAVQEVLEVTCSSGASGAIGYWTSAIFTTARVRRRCISAGLADLQVVGMSPSHSHHVLGGGGGRPNPSHIGGWAASRARLVEPQISLTVACRGRTPRAGRRSQPSPRDTREVDLGGPPIVAGAYHRGRRRMRGRQTCYSPCTPCAAQPACFAGPCL